MTLRFDLTASHSVVDEYHLKISDFNYFTSTLYLSGRDVDELYNLLLRHKVGKAMRGDDPS